MKASLSILFLLLSFSLFAQQVQWSYKVLDYSSQKEERAYSATQVLGMPNVLTPGKENIKAWVPKGNLKEEFIKVGFFNPILPKQLIIIESFNPGSISKIYAYGAKGEEHEIQYTSMKSISATNRILHINTSTLNFYVFAVKLVFTGNTGMSTSIDAIGITESIKPIKFKINQNQLIKSEMIATKLDSNVNSKFPEMGPLISPDGKTLYFSRRGHHEDMGGKNDKEDIWYSEWNEKKKTWSLAKNMGSPLNNLDPNFINSISPDGNTILLGNSYMEDGSMEDGVSISERTNTGWSTPRRLSIEDENKNVSKFANYFFSNSQKILLISNDRKGDSYGDRDLYVSFINKDTSWTKPLNLGTTLNTKGTEAAPFLASDDKTLYFTSDGFVGYGGSDIYVTRRLDDSWTKWSIPENLGPIINTSFDESFMTVNASGKTIYYTSQSDDNSNTDVYSLELPNVLKPLPVLLLLGNVINSKTNEFIAGASITFENLTTGKEVGVAKSNPTFGNFQIILPSGSNYGYLAKKEGFISVNANINLTNLVAYKEQQQNLYLTPLEVGQVIAINNIFFDFDKSELKKESFLELSRLAEVLTKNPTMTIEISANTDSIGTENYNDLLSERRADSVVNYLIQTEKIDKSRILSKHYGENKPATSNKTAVGRKLNRRVEIKIISK